MNNPRSEQLPASAQVIGTWSLVEWRRLELDGSVTHPLGLHPVGQLIYTEDGRMAVQLMAKARPNMPTDTSALHGTSAEQAGAYATYLAYFGTYHISDHVIEHQILGSLFPNWSGTTQSRPFTLHGEHLTLKTPESPGSPVNELRWKRARD